MRKEHLDLLCCPKTGHSLILEEVVLESGRVKSGVLIDSSRQHRYPIINFIPRFVSPSNYCDSFSVEWREHPETLHERYSGFNFARTRYHKETRWGNDLKGLLLLELGCGCGSFTTHALESGATVVSFDYSTGVEANYRVNGAHPNLLLVQADIFNMPFPKKSFDRAFCFGVLQHTPDPKAAFQSMVQMVKPGGKLATDIYTYDPADAMLRMKYWLRSRTPRTDPEKLYQSVARYVNRVWFITWLLGKIPWLGKKINRYVLIDHDFGGQMPGASQKFLKEMNIITIYDMLAPAYDFPQTLQSYRQWHEELGLEDVDVHYGYNGIEGHASAPIKSQALESPHFADQSRKGLHRSGDAA